MGNSPQNKERDKTVILYRGKFVQPDQFVLPGLNYALLWGQSTFTTMRLSDAQILFEREHRERLLRGSLALNLNIEQVFLEEHFLSLKNYSKKDMFSVRVDLVQDLQEELHLFSWLRPFIPQKSVSIQSLTCSGFEEALDFKHPNYLKRFLMKKKAIEEGHSDFDEVLFKDKDDCFTQGAVSNFVFYHNNSWKTSKSPQVFRGISLAKFEDYLSFNNQELIWTKIKSDEEFDSIFRLNALRGLQFVERLDSKCYKITPQICEFLKGFTEFCFKNEKENKY